MNSAFLLITAACLAGGGEKKPTPPPPPPPPVVNPAPIVSPAPAVGQGCCGSNYSYSSSCCDTGCREGFFQKLRHRCGGLFNRNNGCYDSCNSCGGGHVGGWGGGHGGGWGGGHGHQASTGCCTAAPTTSCCTTAASSSCCDTGCGSGWSFGHRFRGLFNRHNNNNCCDSCNSCGTVYGGGTYGGTPVIGGKGPQGEPIGPPIGSQPLPPGGTKPGTTPPGGTKGKGGTAIEPPTSGFDTNIAPESIGNPSLEIVPPAVVPNIPSIPSGKSPF